jgi:inorganic triphosphatase YgiF
MIFMKASPRLQTQSRMDKEPDAPSPPDLLPRPERARASAHAEIELKLRASPAAIEQIRKAPVIVQNARNRGVVRRLDTIYYDTPDQALARQRGSLRVRRNGARYVQTLKLARADRAPFTRQEWETAVDSPAPDLTRLPAEINAALALTANELAPVFATRIRRRAQRLTFGGAEVDIAFDEGTVEAGEQREPLTEIELELKAGDIGALFDVGIQLLDVAPVRIGTLSKADRGYALAFDAVPQVTKAERSAIGPEHCVDDVIAIIMSAGQQHLLANQAIVEDGRDPEGVHQTRVALRRLRTACSLLRREIPSPAFHAFAGEAKWLMQMLSPARDWDVFTTATLARLESACASEVDFDGLRRAAEPHRIASYALLRKALTDPRYTRFQLSLCRWTERRAWRSEVPSEALGTLTQPASALAVRVLARLHRKALKEGAHFARLQPQARHDLRVTLKKLRYAAEFFLPVFAKDPSAKRWLARLAKLQDALGHAQDSTVTRSLLGVAGRAELTPDLHRAAGAAIGWLARDQLAAAKSLRKRWRDFKATPCFWRE